MRARCLIVLLWCQVLVSVGNGTMRPFVLVGIDNTQRRRELTRPT